MTDHTAPAMIASVHTTDEARSRLRKRYRDERIFKGLGMAAITVSVGFLFLLLSTILWKGFPAFTYHFASLPFEVSALDASDPEELAKADYDGIVRKAIRAQFPEVTSRSGRRLLGSVLSSGASVLLRKQTLDDPENLKHTENYSIPISDFGDLYLKGQVTSETWEEGGMTARVSIAENDVTLSSDAPRFGVILDAISNRLRAESAALRNRRAGTIRSRDKAEGDLAAIDTQLTSADANATTSLIKQRDNLTNKLEAARAQIADFGAQADDLDTRADLAPSQGEILALDDPSFLIYANGAVIKATEVTPTSFTGTLLLPFDNAAPAEISDWRMRVLETPESNRKFSDQEIVWTDKLVDSGYVASSFNWIFMTRGASREPEMAGIWGAVVGTFLTLSVTLAVSFPLGVAAAIYLEEFAPKSRWTTFIEVNINNLAAVPSIVFGLLGLAVFLNFFGFDRSAPYVGGMVLALMTLPIIIIASRAALRAVPPSIREAALGIGASRIQTVFHHVLPLAMPGIMTGTIIGMAQALGETAPLLMIGMVAFVVDIPSGLADPATVLPVQIFMWADFPEPAFEQRTSAAILVLLAFLILMNALAVVLRKRFERRW